MLGCLGTQAQSGILSRKLEPDAGFRRCQDSSSQRRFMVSRRKDSEPALTWLIPQILASVSVVFFYVKSTNWTIETDKIWKELGLISLVIFTCQLCEISSNYSAKFVGSGRRNLQEAALDFESLFRWSESMVLIFPTKETLTRRSSCSKRRL